MFENIYFENLVVPIVLLIISNLLTFVSTKTFYKNFKTSFFEFTDIPMVIREAWKDDIVTKEEIIQVAKELKEFADSIKNVKRMV